ncbi:MAG TPA: hypothetical protein VJ890_13645 [Vineibacter sp.]|nr:hypothetical protein [Vineibacter sp.]
MPGLRDTAPLSAPIAVAACALFGEPWSFAREADAETWRAIGPRALHVVRLWRDVAWDRDKVRLGVEALRRWHAAGDLRQAALCRAELVARWARYRKGMRRLADRIDAVRTALSPRNAPAVAAPKAAA